MTSLRSSGKLFYLGIAIFVAIPPIEQAAAQILVNSSGAPGTYSSLQAAIDAAPPNQVIWVQGGSYTGPINITKPVTIVGSGGASIPYKRTSHNGPCINLQGPGSGSVVLAGLSIGGTISGFFSANPTAAISGQGFDELKIHRCSVSGAVWTGLTGFGAGTGALSTTMPLVMIAHSSMTGAPNDTDNYYYKVPQSPVAVATSGTLVLVDSQVNGAPGVPYYWTPFFGDWPPDPQPCPCPKLTTYNCGGPATSAENVYNVNSIVAGGAGGNVSLYDSTTGGFVAYGAQPDGVAYKTLPNHVFTIPDVGLSAATPMQIGQGWLLDYPVAWNGATLYVAFDVTDPYAIGSFGYAFFTGAQLVAATPLPQGTTSIGFLWPNEPVLIGIELDWQLFDGSLGLSRPIVDIVMP